LKKENPDAVLVLGDTNSCLAAYMAKRMHIPVFHMEAGNRCFDFNVPEEINRRIIDHIADFNLVYSEHARRHLISEGLPHRRIYLTGSPMREVINYYLPKIKKSEVLEILKLKSENYFLVSSHREENVDNKNYLRKILIILNELAEEYNLPIIVSTHPRTRKRLEKMTDCKMNPLIEFLKPFGYLDYIFLQMNALCTLSDSGTISEESSILNFPAISLRQSMERPEAQDTGAIILTGFDVDVVLNSVAISISGSQKSVCKEVPMDYQVENTSWRVLKLLIGNSNLSNKWHGINIVSS
jgi:UDP-N-acetylglucosamine 2-epimerase (non-hydrolysing)